jgi:hypothetical protein
LKAKKKKNTYGIRECVGRITAVSTNKRRFVNPTASSELNLMETTETEMEEDWRQNS